jgi:transposase
MPERSRFSTEVRERAVRMVVEHASDHPSRWAAITSMATTIGCSAQTLSHWVARFETDAGRRPGVSTDEQARVQALEREVKALRRANDIVRKASAYCAQAELDRRGS